MRARVVLNALALRPGGSGVQTYIRELLRHLPEQLDADVAAIVQSDALGEVPAGVETIVRPPSDGVLRALAGARGIGRSDLVHGLNVALPLGHHGAAVATVHDLSYFDTPWAYSRRRAAGGRLLASSSIRRADALIAVSRFTAGRILDLFGREAVVVPEAPADDMRPPAPEEVAKVRAVYALPSRFVLHVGTVEPRKDIPGLAAACRIASVPLVLAGATRRRAQFPDGARGLGYVPREHLPGLYAAASLVAYPSRYEGFGLPPLEAMACGAPVVATAVPALSEALEGAAELVPAGDVEALARCLAELLSDEDRLAEMGRSGLDHVACLSWSATAAATAEVYRSLGLRA